MSETTNLAKKQEIALRDKRHLLSDIAVPIPDDCWNYQLALHMTGVKVIGYEMFGSYQGDWWALVEFPNHERYFVGGSYGSCSGCDAFEAEFGWNDESKPDYAHRLRDFGLEYLTDCRTREQAVEEASHNLSWDHDAQGMVDWLIRVGTTPAPEVSNDPS